MVSVNAANQQRGLAILVLKVHIDSAANEKSDNGFLVVSAGHMQGCTKVVVQ